MIDIDEQIKIILKGVDEIIGLEELKEKLHKKEKLVIKLVPKLILQIGKKTFLKIIIS